MPWRICFYLDDCHVEFKGDLQCRQYPAVMSVRVRTGKLRSYVGYGVDVQDGYREGRRVHKL